ncbi:FecR domain-containing protein [Candidatus Gracilibacteria bacterium]|nr:FecR domain-containing protein [Candidatus Gracilibacteria bacterium]
MDPINTKSGLEELMARLESSAKPNLDSARKDAMKQRLMSKIKLSSHQQVDHSIFSLVGAVRVLAEKVELSAVKKAEMKERIMERIEQAPQTSFFFSNYFSMMKRMVSATLILAISFGMLSFLSVDTYVVSAGTFTTLDSFKGDVSIQRSQSLIPANVGMALMENDKLITGANGSAEIRYFDNSVSRMSNNTEVQINKLVSPNDNSVNTYVEVSLVEGQVWSRVLNLVESDSSFVVKANNVSAAAKKAAFNVEINNGKVEIGVFNHAVSINAAGKTEQILSGEKLVVDEGPKGVSQLKLAERDSGWVKENMQNDHAYLTQVEQRLIEAKRKAVGLNDAGEVSYINSLREDALLFLTFDDVKKKKFDLDLAERNFIAAQVKLNDPNILEADKADAQAAMQKFGDKLKGFYQMVAEVEHTDKAYAEELRNYVDSKVLVQKKDLNMALPDSPNYLAKNILDDAQLVGTDNQIDKLRLKVDQAADKLAAAEDARDSGRNELANKAVDDYKKDITGVVLMIDNLPKDAPAVKDELALKVSDNIDLLKAINVVPTQRVVELEQIVKPVVEKDIIIPAAIVSVPAETITETEAVEPVEIVDAVDTANTTEVVDGPYGVQMEGDKPLPPLFQDVQ